MLSHDRIISHAFVEKGKGELFPQNFIFAYLDLRIVIYQLVRDNMVVMAVQFIRQSANTDTMIGNQPNSETPSSTTGNFPLYSLCLGM